ncbi:hypothetical protein SUGI_0717740 [Cryptomeria japonica]|nr:hypothetical protein SUGI_0717740 [Cryptomeria japonica]
MSVEVGIVCSLEHSSHSEVKIWCYLWQGLQNQGWCLGWEEKTYRVSSCNLSLLLHVKGPSAGCTRGVKSNTIGYKKFSRPLKAVIIKLDTHIWTKREKDKSTDSGKMQMMRMKNTKMKM